MYPQEDFVPIYLASQSARRRTLLTQIGVDFHPLAVSVDEAVLPADTPNQHVERLAVLKARSGEAQVHAHDLEVRPVLGADTAVVLGGQIFGKPENQDQACAMLCQLSGTVHQVFTAVALCHDEFKVVVTNTSSVWFRKLDENEILAYWQTGEPWGKAGGYAIQGRAAVFIERVEGSYSGVMGLPLYETATLLRQIASRS